MSRFWACVLIAYLTLLNHSSQNLAQAARAFFCAACTTFANADGDTAFCGFHKLSSCLGHAMPVVQSEANDNMQQAACAGVWFAVCVTSALDDVELTLSL